MPSEAEDETSNALEAGALPLPALGPETCNGLDDDGNGAIDEVGCGADAAAPSPAAPDAAPDAAMGRVPCTGTGLVYKSPDGDCIDDGGKSAKDDRLQVYCVNNVARFCLSKEACPWRDGQTTNDAITCSRAGLTSDYMAAAEKACGIWNGKERYCCSPAGLVSFSGC